MKAFYVAVNIKLPINKHQMHSIFICEREAETLLKSLRILHPHFISLRCRIKVIIECYGIEGERERRRPMKIFWRIVLKISMIIKYVLCKHITTRCEQKESYKTLMSESLLLSPISLSPFSRCALAKLLFALPCFLLSLLYCPENEWQILLLLLAFSPYVFRWRFPYTTRRWNINYVYYEFMLFMQAWATFIALLIYFFYRIFLTKRFTEHLQSWETFRRLCDLHAILQAIAAISLRIPALMTYLGPQGEAKY